jgi:hypothetical protein
MLFILQNVLPKQKDFLVITLVQKTQFLQDQYLVLNFLQEDFQPADITIAERAGQTFSKPRTYVPAAIGAVTGAFNNPPTNMKSQRLAHQQTQDLEIIV